jgi:hypothetical protein
MLNKPIHICLWSSQPDILIECDKSWTTPSWAKHQDILPENIYYSSDDRLYSFDEELVTCEKCLIEIQKINHK